MPARAISTGTVSFGLVSIPVKVYSATSPSGGIHFNLLHGKCGSRLKQQYLCPQDGEKVERDDMVKGYEFAKDRYVTFTAEEIKAIEEPGTQAIEIAEFVPADQVEPVYFDKPYYLGPDKGGDRAYRLLVRAMQETGRVGLARYAARGKQYLVMVRPYRGRLLMQQLLYADEVRPSDEIPIGDAELREGELRLATQVIGQIARETFDPSGYQDEVRKRAEAMIQRKVEGEQITAAPGEEPRAQIIDLMEALKASLAARGGAPAAAQAAAEPAAAYGAPEPATAGTPEPAPARRPARRAASRAAPVRKRAKA